MTPTQRMRHRLAQHGIERTNAEAGEILCLARYILGNLTNEDHRRYLSMTKDDIRQMAADEGISTEDAQAAINTLICAGNTSFGE